jgi:hypothetical protein
MKHQLLSLPDVIALLAKRCDEAGSQKAFAEANNISAQYVSDVLKQKREPGEAILRALGLQKVESYRMLAVVRVPRRGGKVELKIANCPWDSAPAHGWTFDQQRQEFIFQSGRKMSRYQLSKTQIDSQYYYGDVPISPHGEIIMSESE